MFYFLQFVSLDSQCTALCNTLGTVHKRRPQSGFVQCGQEGGTSALFGAKTSVFEIYAVSARTRNV